MEKVHLKKVRSQAKIAGTLVTVAGAMLMTLYKGPVVEMVWNKHAHAQTAEVATSAAAAAADKDWFKGSVFLIIACLAWAAFFILQVKTAEESQNPHQRDIIILPIMFILHG